MEETAKEALLARFRTYLDASEGTHTAPTQTPDLFSLLAELAALKTEVKVESRQVKGALDEFRELFDLLRDAHERLGEEQRRRRELEASAKDDAQRELLLELLELRDRMQAGWRQTEDFHPRGLCGRANSRRFVASMAEGMAMNLRRLDETLARRGVTPMVTVDRPFDPHRMRAAEITEDPDRAEGRVVAELRPGYLLNDQLLRLAEVVVNRPTRRP